MYGKMFSSCLHGIDGVIIEVEADLASGLPQTHIVGLPDSAVREAVERVRAAVKNCGFVYPLQRVTVNLAPADLRKEGASFDLAIALTLLVASGQLEISSYEKLLIIGELSLDGAVRTVPGVLPMVEKARREGFTSVLVPLGNAEEALLLQGIKVYGISHLRQLLDDSNHAVGKVDKENREAHFISRNCGTASSPMERLLVRPGERFSSSQLEASEDYVDVLGQQHVKRALTIAAAGRHNILLVGPPGTGKTMLLRRLPTILPPLTEAEALEITKIYSSAGKLHQTNRGLISARPFRSPHHTISAAGLVGGGIVPKPGEVSLAHHGVLFLDELPEFSRGALEVLRQPLEERMVTISRSKAAYTFPANILLGAAMNPCPCGFLGAQSPLPGCACSSYRVTQYRERVSGPLLDRIDMHVEVPMPRIWMEQTETSVNSMEMREQVIIAEEFQQQRYAGELVNHNGELSGRMLRKYATMSDGAEQLLKNSFTMLGMSMRAFDKLIKLSRTIADLEREKVIQNRHIAEALQYRQLDRSIQNI